jgi:hypothetical protein
MIRFLLFAMFAAAITAIVVLVRMPMAPGTPVPVAVEAAPGTAKPGKTSAKKSAPSLNRSGKTSTGKTQPAFAVSSTETATVAGSPVRDPASPAGLLEQKTTVKDDAALYPSNSVRARAVGVLKRGEPVESDIEVLDTGGRWSLVQGSKQNRQGFVRSENLKRSTGQP